MNKLHHTANRLVSKQINHTYLKVSIPSMYGSCRIDVYIDNGIDDDKLLVSQIEDVTDEVKKLKKKTRKLNIPLE